jgi:hypothetical protein
MRSRALTAAGLLTISVCAGSALAFAKRAEAQGRPFAKRAEAQGRHNR